MPKGKKGKTRASRPTFNDLLSGAIDPDEYYAYVERRSPPTFEDLVEEGDVKGVVLQGQPFGLEVCLVDDEPRLLDTRDDLDRVAEGILCRLQKGAAVADLAHGVGADSAH